MSDAVNGDPKVDARAIEIGKTIEELDFVMCKNLDLEVAKKIRLQMVKAIAELDSAMMTKVEQKLGGHIGGTKGQGSRIKTLEDKMVQVWKALSGDSHG
jgi:hypothetical protein